MFDKKGILGKAIADTATEEVKGKKGYDKPSNTEESPFGMEDGTVTISQDIVGDVKENDIVQFNVVAITEDGVVMKPVESRIKNEGVSNKDVKAEGTDNSMAVGTEVK